MRTFTDYCVGIVTDPSNSDTDEFISQVDGAGSIEELELGFTIFTLFGLAADSPWVTMLFTGFVARIAVELSRRHKKRVEELEAELEAIKNGSIVPGPGGSGNFTMPAFASS